MLRSAPNNSSEETGLKDLGRRKFLETILGASGLVALGPFACSGDNESPSDNNESPSDNLALELTNTDTKDLSRYKGKSFKVASISYTDVSDLSPLQGMPIEHIDMAFSLVEDLEALRGITTLKVLDIRGTDITDLSPIRYSWLEQIYLNENVTDLSPIWHSIRAGARVILPTGYRINRTNKTLEKDDGPPMKVYEDDAGAMTLDFFG